MTGKYFSLHHRLLAWIGRLTNTIILIPNPAAIGNASEDYYFGLLAARREGKKLVVLFPLQLHGRFKLQLFDPAILFLESDLLAVKYGGRVSSLLSGIFTLYWIVLRSVILRLERIFNFKTSGYYWRPLAGQDILWRPNASVTKFDWVLAREQEWETQILTPIELFLSPEKERLCEVEREQMGLPHDAWFVCLHVREGGYKGDWENPRNADISNYFGAIKEITQQGGWVVRMGDSTMTTLPDLERVIDYAHSSSKSAIMDVYLLKESSFYIGTSSGTMDTAYLLCKPMIITNMMHLINGFPLRQGDIGLFKHVYSEKQKRFLSIKEWLLRASEMAPDIVGDFSAPDWRFYENSAEEITSAVKEFMAPNHTGGTEPLQNEFRRFYICAIQELSETIRFGSTDLENCNEWFRFASRMLAWKGEISAGFLKQNWLECSRRSLEKNDSISEQRS
jgi:putative glycosyltransferase (TIGR04372 family)